MIRVVMVVIVVVARKPWRHKDDQNKVSEPKGFKNIELNINYSVSRKCKQNVTGAETKVYLLLGSWSEKTYQGRRWSCERERVSQDVTGQRSGEWWGCPNRGKRCSLRACGMYGKQGRQREIQNVAGKYTQHQAGEGKGPECNI